MKIAVACAALLAVPVLGLAKSETVRIEVLHGKQALVVLSGAQTAGQFTIWSGPGTGTTAADGTVSTPAHPGDIADWAAGIVQPPRDARVYKVLFYCADPAAPARDGVPMRQCYGVRYAIADDGAAFIQIPELRDEEFGGDTQSIYRGVEGSWFRASRLWATLVRPRLEEVLASTSTGAPAR